MILLEERLFTVTRIRVNDGYVEVGVKIIAD
jgi:hypothetical protein